MVEETESENSRKFSRTAWQSVLLPAPEGAQRIKKRLVEEFTNRLSLYGGWTDLFFEILNVDHLTAL